MNSRWTHLGAWALGCMVAVILAPYLRIIVSPWRAIGPDKVVMFSSDSCEISRRAVALVEADARLSHFIVPVPAGGPGQPAPVICAASLSILRQQHPGLRAIPDALACRWLIEDAFAAIPAGGVATPSWYFEGHFADRAGSAEEAALFHAHGWRIEWTHTGLRLSPLDGPAPQTEKAPEIRRIEDLGMSSFRDDRW